MLWGALAIVLSGAVTTTVLRMRAAPAGSFHSFGIFPHDNLDLLTFEAGQVTLRTCCGNSDWGLYRQEPDGRWLWTWPSRNNPATTSTWIVEPGALFMTFSDPQTATSFTMRRRLFEKIPF